MKRDIEKRRTPPLAVKLEVALRQLASFMGCEPGDLQVDHDPALGLRPVDPTTKKHIPHQHEPGALVWRARSDHALKTTGRRGESKLSISYDGDQSRIAKTVRVEKRHEEARRRMLAKSTGEVQEPPPKRKGAKIPSRPFSASKRPMRRKP